MNASDKAFAKKISSTMEINSGEASTKMSMD